MANYQSLKTAINAVIKANGNKEITGTVLNEVLLAMVNSLGAGYQFAGVATPSTNPGTPDQKVFYIASQAGTYTNFGGAVVSDGIAIFKWNDTWTTEMLDLSMAGQVQSDWTETDTTKKSYIKHKPNIPPSANVDPVPTKDSPNAVSSGGTYNMIVSTAATLFGNIQDATNVNATLSEDGKIYNDYNAGDIFYIEQDDVRKYRVAYAAGTADAEHPVTINGTLFYYADNASDAIWLSLRIKTVSTEQQSLSAQQKAQARTNIAAVSYDQQSLNADQQVQAQNNVMGKAYSSAASDHSGLGKVYLAKNNGVLTQAMMPIATQEGEEDPGRNTVYVIQYDYTLEANITIPAGCTLEFDGGSISGNGTGKDTITGNNTGIEAGLVKIFSNIVVSGSWNVNKIYSDWCDNDTIGLRNLVNLSSDNIYNIIYLEGGNYIGIVDAVNNSLLDLKSNTVLEFNTTIELQTNRLDRYSIISVGGKKNVSIVGSGIIIGDADTHTLAGEGFCHGITIWESENVKIEGLTIQKCFTDCIYVSGGSPSKNIRINDCQLKESRRQGISVTNCVIFDISNCFISDILGTDPERCIDIEPNANGICKSGTICNNRFDSNRGLVCNGGATGAVVDGIFVKNNIFNNTEYSLDNVYSNNIYIDRNIINSGSISINSGTNIHISNNIINCQNFKLYAISSIICNKIKANIFVTSSSTELKDNAINGNVSFGTSDIRLSGNTIYNNSIYGDLFVNSSDSEICNNLLLGKNDIRNAFSIRNNRFTYFTRIENDVVLTAINVKQVADNLFNTFNDSESASAQSLFTFISVTAFPYSTVISGNSFINNDAQLSQYFCAISPSSNTQRLFAYNNLCSEENKTYGNYSKVFGTVVRYKNRGAENDAPTLPVTAIGNVYWDTDNNRPLYWNGTDWVDATGTPV